MTARRAAGGGRQVAGRRPRSHPRVAPLYTHPTISGGVVRGGCRPSESFVLRPPSRQPAQHPALSSALSRPTTICCTQTRSHYTGHFSLSLCLLCCKSERPCPQNQQVPPKDTAAFGSQTHSLPRRTRDARFFMRQELIRYSRCWMLQR